MFFDLHNDFPTAISDYSKYISGRRSTVITAAVWTTGLPYSRILQILSALQNLTPAVPIGIEDVGFLGEGGYGAFDFSRYHYCSLTWNKNNVFAGGALDDGDLTNAGRCIISAVNGTECVLDLAHLNKKSFYSAIGIAKNVICSHTGFNRHPRSLDSEQIRAIVDRRGLIGLSAVTAFTNATDADSFARVVDGFVQTYGDKSLAIGTDFYGSTDIPADINGYNKFIPNVRSRLKAFGYTDTAVQNIFYGNAYNYFKAIRGEQ